MGLLFTFSSKIVQRRETKDEIKCSKEHNNTTSLWKGSDKTPTLIKAVLCGFPKEIHKYQI